MVTLNLDKFLTGHVYAFVMILCRVGSVLTLFPGIAETFVPVRMRMAFAMALCFLLMEPLMGRLPAPPQTFGGMVLIMGYEIFIGLFFGTFLRLLMGALESAGAIIALQTGLSNATILNPALASQSPLASAFLSIVGLTLVFVTGLDHFLLRSIMALYDLFPPGETVAAGDTTQVIVQAVSRSFNIGIEMAVPFFIMGLLMFIALGMLQKLMPQVQLFMVALPVQIWGGIALIALTVAGIMNVWLHYFDNSVGQFFTH
jgi:flagellar biosynthetic protein FliR